MIDASSSFRGSSELPLRDNETVEETIHEGANRFIITNHRLFHVEAGAPSINWALERPNIAEIYSTSTGGKRLRKWAVSAMVLGPILFVSGIVVPWDGIMPDSPISEAGLETEVPFNVDWALRLFDIIFTALSHIDTILVVGGVLITGLGIPLLLGWFIRRNPVLAIETADGRVFHANSFDSSDARIKAALADDQSHQGG